MFGREGLTRALEALGALYHDPSAGFLGELVRILALLGVEVSDDDLST